MFGIPLQPHATGQTHLNGFLTKLAAILVACREGLSEKYCGVPTGLVEPDDLSLMLQESQ